MVREKSPRIGRVNDLLQRSLAKLIRDECRDPRLGTVTVSMVDITNNLEFAKVFVTVLEDDKVEQSLIVLNKAAGFLRKQLACAISFLKIIPKLKFLYDDSVIDGKRMDVLLESLTVDAAG